MTQSKSRRGVTSRRIVVFLLPFLLGGLLSACTSPTGALSPSASPCFGTLPLARAAVGDRGTLLGVRLLTEVTIDAALARHGETPMPLGPFPAITRLCLVGYSGPFRAEQVRSPWPPNTDSGAAVLVVFSPDRRRVLWSVLVRHSPLRLGRL